MAEPARRPSAVCIGKSQSGSTHSSGTGTLQHGHPTTSWQCRHGHA